MARKLATILILLAALLPSQSFALGLGEIDLRSYLNQPLNARIPLLSADETTLADLQVKIAGPADYARAGLDYSSVSSGIRIKVVKTKTGAYVQLSTSKPFREPYLSILLEISWGSGRLLREYTLLIDPPSTISGSKPAPVAVAPAAPAAPTAPAPRSAGVPPTTRSVAPRRVAPSAPSFDGDVYGPVGRNDTLWNIAKKTRPDSSVTVEQMMLALQRKNPAAFMGSNINRLKQGSTLNIPSETEITSLTPREARAEVRSQYRAWKQARTGQTAPAPAPTDKGGKLRVLAPRTGEGSDGAGVAGATGKGSTGTELNKAREAARASEREKKVLETRLRAMEQQLERMKKLARLKNDQLAALQAKLAELRRQQAIAAGKQPPAEPAAPAAKEPAPAEPAAKAPAEQPAQPPAKKAYERVPAKTAKPGTPINQHKVEGFKKVDTASLPKDKVAEPFAKAPAPTPAAGKSFMDKAMDFYNQNTTMVIAAGAGGLVFLLLIWLLVQRRRAAASFQESILSETRPVAAPVSEPELEAEAAAEEAAISNLEPAPEEAAPSSSHGGVNDAASSYLSDFTVSGMDAVDSDVTESDPITEADVFLAYGRFEPAEAMIREAISAEPDRGDLKMKLLEIHYQAKDAEAFERDAGEYQSGLSEEEWHRTSEMGRELCAGSSLFEAAAEPTGAAASDEDPGFAFSEFEVPEGEEGEASDMEAELKDMAEPEQEVEPVSLEDDAVEFDLTEFEEDTSAEGDAAGLEDIEFDLGELDAAESAEPAEADDIAADLADELAEIAEVIETPEPAEQAADAEVAAEVEQAVEGLGDIEDEDLGGELDEIGTKLDLARAYIDMGDPDGARSILDEVLEEGNDAQKQEATELMGQL